MLPFRITCETCRARLKIRDASVIGEIHACPRCGGMVLIAPPPDWTGEPASGEPASTGGNSSSVTMPAPSNQFSDFAIDESLIVPPSVTAVQATSPSVAPVVSAVSDPAAIRSPTATPSLLERTLAQPILLWGGLAAVMTFVGGFSTAMLLMQNDPPPRTVAAAAVDASPPAKPAAAPSLDRQALEVETAADNPYRAAIDREHANKQTVTAAAKPLQPALHRVERPVADEPPPLETDAPVAIQPQLPELPPDEPPEDADSSQLAASDRAETSEPAHKDQSRKPVLKFDPLNFDPLALGFSESEPTDNPQPSATSVADDPATADALPTPPEPEGEAASDENIASAPEEDETITAARGPHENNAPPVDVATQLALPIDSIQMSDVPLARFVARMAQLAGTSITLDPAALAMAGASPRETVSIRARNTTLDKLLRVTLKKHRLDLVERGGRLHVVRPNLDQRRTVNYGLADLVTDGDASHLAALLQRHVAPESWQNAGGTGMIDMDGTMLRIEATHAVHYEALIFFERLRTARGLSPRSNYPTKLLSTESPYTKLAEPLGKSATFTFLPWTPLADVVRYWEDATGLVILVNWPALADLDLAPTSPISCSAIDRTWEDALTTILSELDLTWRAVSGDTIQITSLAVADQQRTIEFYAVPESLLEQFASPAALAVELQTQLTEEANASVAAIELQFDAPSGRLIALANDAAHRALTKRLSTPVSTADVVSTVLP